MAKFRIQNRLALNHSKPMTVITVPEAIDRALDDIRLSGDNRLVADKLLHDKDGGCATLYRMVDGEAVRCTVIVLKPQKSRNLPNINVIGLGKQLKSEYFGKDASIYLALGSEEDDDYVSVVTAVVKASPDFSRKTEKSEQASCINIVIADLLSKNAMDRLQAIAQVVPMVGRLVDTPTIDMTCEEFGDEVYKTAKALGLGYECISGTSLLVKGFGGIYHVGKSGNTQPRLIILKYRSPKSRHHVALVGKGIVYDTGGLCLKPRDHMATMKSDMGGAAAVFGAIQLAALTKLDIDVTALLCVAENGIGPSALRPDDIIEMYSGLTVEINNTDAEGRLVLADGVSYASRMDGVDLIMDMATLTGAQLICTGKLHAGVLTADEKLENALLKAGKCCGELVYPLLYAPEILMDEFKSEVADMKNSCKDRMNAQSSCAGHFIEKHLDKKYKGRFAHIDIAGPAWSGERSTAYGSVLLDTVLRML